jgi:heme-degrading monooxygenase HmoA
MSRFAKTPEPPYYVVVFTALRKDADPAYDEMAERVFGLASAQPGFLGLESCHDAEGFAVTALYYADQESILAWKQNAEHLEAQRLGKQRWYAQYQIRVARVERAYGGP